MNVPAFVRRLAAVALVSLTLLPADAAAQGRLQLLGSGRGQPEFRGADAVRVDPTRGLERVREVKPDLAVLDRVRETLARRPQAAVELDIPVFDNLTLTVQLDRFENARKGVVAYYGSVKGAPFSSATLVVSNGVLAGTLHAYGKAYQIILGRDGRYRAQEIDRDQLQDHGDLEVPIPAHIPPSKALVQADDGSTIDLLVVYTPQALAGAGSTPALLSQIDLAVAVTNQAYANSGVVQRLRLVSAQAVTYNDSGDMNTDLYRLSNKNSSGVSVPPDGFLDEVQGMRDAVGADVVSLWIENGGASVAGLGWLMTSVSNGFETYAYNVVRRDQAASNLTLAHELGHNMGLRHDAYVDSDVTTPYAWAHGYVYIDATQRFRTVMAYNNKCAATAPNTACTRITSFSSPLFNYNGVATGNAASADAARVLNDTRSTVANFRQAVPDAGQIAPRLATATVAENAGSVSIAIARLGGSLGAASINYSTSAGNAIPGTDYTNVTGTLNWADGDAADKNVNVPILDDNVADGPRTFTLTLSGATGAVQGAPTSVAVTITDNEPDAFPVGCAAPSGWTTPAGATAGWIPTNESSVEGSCSFRSASMANPPTTEPGCTTGTISYSRAQTQFTGTFVNGNITFSARTSSEASYDCLRFTIDGVQQNIGACSGGGGLGQTPAPGGNDSGWQPFSIPVSAGSHTLRFSYEADCYSDGLNAAFVDNLALPIDPASLPTLNFSQPTYSVTEGGATVNVQVARAGPTTGAVSVTWTTANGTAIAGTDFGASGNPAQRTGTLSWAAGDAAPKNITVGTGVLVNVPVIDDTAFESAETFTINLSAPTGGAVIGATGSATVTINDNESTVEFATSAIEVNEAGPNVTLQVTRTGSTASTATVNYTLTAGTAAALTDFGTTPGTVTFGPGETLKSITIGPVSAAAPYVSIVNDSAIEANETFTISLASPTGGAVIGATSSAVVTIVSDDRGVAMGSATQNVGESDGNAFIPVLRLGSASGAVSVGYTFTNGTAVNGAHYTGVAGTASWADGDTATKYIPVPLIDDAAVNANRTFTVTLGSPVGATIGTPSATTVTIVDNDNTLQFATGTATVAEGGGTVVLSVTRMGGIAGAASVNWSTADGSATAPADYTASSGTLNWAAGDGAAKTISIPIVQDAAIEGNETFTVNLSGATGLGASVGTIATATVTITDDEAGVSFSQPTYTVTEGGPQVNVTVNRSGSATNAITVTWTTANGTALAGQDFGTAGNAAQKTGVLSWLANDSTPKTISLGSAIAQVPIINDNVMEASETFTITLSNPTGGAAIGTTSTATVTILDDDSTIQFGTAAISVSEAGPNVVLPVVRTGSTAASQTVNYTPASGTAMQLSDWNGSAGTITFAAGETVKNITIGPVSAAAPYIAIVNDSAIEGPEAFTITLSAPSAGVTLGATSVATVTIDSDDKGVTMASATLNLVESAGATGIAVTRSGSAAGTLQVNYAFTNGTAINGTHYTGTPGVLAWADGDTATKYIPVTIVDDAVVNTNRTFTATLSAPVGASLGTPSSTTVTIQDNDNTVQLTAATATVTEGTPTISIPVSRLGGVGGAASVAWSTANGTALSGSDFGAAGNPAAVMGVLNWAAGDGAAKNIVVPIIDDGIVEGAKTFTVTISTPVGATLGALTSVTVTLNDNDAGVVFSQPTYTVGEAGGNVVLTVNRIGPTTSSASVTWTTANGSATSGQDFGVAGSATPRTGLLSWLAGDAAPKTITIPILNDALNEGSETFTVALSAPSAGLVVGTPGTATVTIVDDDIPPESTVQFNPVKVVVVEGTPNAVLTVTRTGAAFTYAATVNYATTAGTAMALSDFTAVTGTLTWAPGDSSPKTILVPIVNDAIAENPEQFTVTLSGVSPGTGLGTDFKATVLILDDDEVFPPGGAMPPGVVVPGGATAGWHVSNDPGAYNGMYTLKSDEIDDGQTAQIQFTATFAAGNVSFVARVSSEAGFDFLRFYIDGVKAGEWSGTSNTGWQLASFPLAAGSHTLRWSYEKDASAAMGQDAAWIDSVVVPTVLGP